MSRISHGMVTTGLEIPKHPIAHSLGPVRGIVVRSRSIIGSFGAGIQTIFGGNITIYADMCERARQDALALMIEHAEQMGANAIVGMRYDANEIMAGVTEVLAYGTAVVVE